MRGWRYEDEAKETVKKGKRSGFVAAKNQVTGKWL